MYVWSSHIVEYGSTGQGCQSCSWPAEQGENYIPLSPCVPENLVSRDGFSCPVPRQPAHLHIQAESGAYLRDSSPYLQHRVATLLLQHGPRHQNHPTSIPFWKCTLVVFGSCKHPSTVCITEVMIIENTKPNLIFDVIFLYCIPYYCTVVRNSWSKNTVYLV